MAPHQGRSGVPVGAPNAALLIDFDNVTMGIRSDLTRQLKELLNSDIIKGKVAVQRAYADWRRYAQYIVPLSEASVDLIFAPAYGSSKKNATDIRLAIDALELVFTRPEIGVFILLSGDSDFSSLVLKLKEYGKYVIGVGLRESASDLLVQNCDEYFSYSSLTGLTRAGEDEVISAVDPWDLTERAVRQMADQNDVMRSDRLKQVMLELDATFDESQLGYSKFNRFLTEAASRNRLGLRKLDNGQYEVQPFEPGEKETGRESRRGRGRREPRREEQARREESRTERRPQAAPAAPLPERAPAKPAPRPATRERKEEDVQRGYHLLQRAVKELTGGGGAARDSDIKRRMLDMEAGWDESALGFTKFSRFLRQAHDAEVIDLQKTGEGYYEARLTRGAAVADTGRARREERTEERGGRDRDRGRRGREPRADREERAEREERTERDARAEREDRAERPERQERPRRGEIAAETGAAVTEAATPSAGPGSTEAAAEEASEARAEETPEPKEEREPATESEPRTPRSFGRGARGRRPDGPPPLLPGQVVGGTAPAGRDAAAKRKQPAEAEQSVAEADSRAERIAADATAPAKETERKKGAERPDRSGPTEPPAQKPEVRAPARSKAVQAEPQEEPAPEAREEARDEAPEEAPEESRARPALGAGADFDATELGLPTDSGSVIRYLSNSYPGVGQKTAETLIDAFGADRVFHGLNADPERVRDILGSGRRTEALLEAWQKDYRRRTTAGAAGSAAQPEEAAGTA